MDDISLGVLVATLVLFLLLAAFFSAAETSMMAVNRYRLRALAAQGHRAAKLTQQLLNKTDELLGVVLIGSNLLNSASAALVTVISFRLFGRDELALTLATLFVTFLILVFAELTPKVAGATYPEQIAHASSFVLAPLRKLLYPAVWFVNLFVTGLLRLFRLSKGRAGEQGHLGVEELRTLVSESGKLLPGQHREILLNLLSLESVTVDDVMTPRNQIEALDLTDEPERLVQQLSTSHHTQVPVYEGSPDNIVGILHVRRALRPILAGEVTAASLREIVSEPYFVPGGTPLFTQLRHFQDNQKRLALVVDEYGELQGLLSLEDILEELIGEFTTQAPGQLGWLRPTEDGGWLVEGTALLRHLNRKLGLDFPLDGPRTLNGVILERLEDIPEAGVSVKIGEIPIEIVQTQGRVVKVAKLYPAQPIAAENGTTHGRA
ncbi:MAG TPA: HlyC/CorC family transporter [Thiobacillaceae bacterium]|nr:HlyC/CorC family transporter [Thiobacillaceae bacterium]